MKVKRQFTCSIRAAGHQQAHVRAALHCGIAGGLGTSHEIVLVMLMVIGVATHITSFMPCGGGHVKQLQQIFENVKLYKHYVSVHYII